jgi:Ca-activated chloride channel family protein
MVRSRPDPGLRRLSDETGGGYFEIDKSSDLAPAFTRIANELHSQYVLAFSPPALDGKIHRLTVRAKRTGLVVRARKSYLASTDTPTKK